MSVSAEAVRRRLLLRCELALLDVRDEAEFAEGHPLFAAQLPAGRIAIEAAARLPRKDVFIVLYGDEQDAAGRAFDALGYSNVHHLEGGLAGWTEAGYELFRDVNSYAKAFGELVASRRRTPLLAPAALAELQARRSDLAILDARRFDEYQAMSIPGALSAPGAELVWRAASAAPSPQTTIVVNCAGRTRSILGAQSLLNAGLPNPIFALENGTIGWTLAHQPLDRGQTRRAASPSPEHAAEARTRAREVSYRAGVRIVDRAGLVALGGDSRRTLYRFDVRPPEDYVRGHLEGFTSAPGGQLVQEIDAFAPVRGARIVLADDQGARADMTASWLAQMGWEVYVLDARVAWSPLEVGDPQALTPRPTKGRYRRPYEGTDVPPAAMQAYLDWEFGLEAQLARDATHGFFVI